MGVGIAEFVVESTSHGHAPSLIDGDTVLTYDDLNDRIAQLGQEWGPTPKLIAMQAGNTLGCVVAYLAALRHHHPVVLLSGGAPTWLQADITVAEDGSYERTGRTAGASLHPDLAVMLATSGSTGSPKLVRLSRANVIANARSIAQSLHLDHTDRAMLSLPLGYSYGLSVLNSHLSVGASVILSRESVADPCFWERVSQHRPTSLPTVPYTFQLLDGTRFGSEGIPGLRRVTVAGGRLDPARVIELSQQGQRQGWDLYVMYGQTEATARMSVLPPDLAAGHPDCVGVAIPGGRFWIEDQSGRTWHGEDPAYRGQIGELWFEGPNVMMGYAESMADLRRGDETPRLRTGDLARFQDGLVQITGRRSDFAKICGKRVDLGHLQSQLVKGGVDSCVLEVQEHLVVLYEQQLAAADLSDRVAELLQGLVTLPADHLRTVPVSQLPRTSSGKLDRARALQIIGPLPASSEAGIAGRPGGGSPHRWWPGSGGRSRTAPERQANIRQIYAQALPRGTVLRSDRSFSQLGGDSMSYVRVSARLSAALGGLPTAWHLMSIEDLAQYRSAQRFHRLDTSVVLRALAILAVVGSHIGLLNVRGGAHLLLAVVGFNFARFQLADVSLARRRAKMGRSLLRFLVPSVIWLVILAAFFAEYSWNVVFGMNLFGPPDHAPEWRYWFLEAGAFLLIGATLLLTIPSLDRLQRRNPSWFAAAMVLLSALLLLTASRTPDGAGSMYTPVLVAWLFAIGWWAATARTRGLKVLIALIAVPFTLAFFDGSLSRQILVSVGLLLLLVVPSIPVPRLLTGGVSLLASASLFIYLTHYQVYPLFGEQLWLGLVASLSVGVVAWYGSEKLWQARLPRRSIVVAHARA